MRYFIVSILFLPFAAIAEDTNVLPPLSPPYDQIPPTFLEQHGAIILIGGFICLELVAIVLWQILKAKPQPVLPPDVIARKALAGLQRRPEDGKTLSEISQVLRRYIAAAFGFPAGELTTTEFSAALAGNEKIGADLAQSISNFLCECDERKFSSTNAGPPLNAASRALELVTLAEKTRDRRDACPTEK